MPDVQDLLGGRKRYLPVEDTLARREPRHRVTYWPTKRYPERGFVNDPEGLSFDTGEGIARGHFDFSECDPPDYDQFPLNGRTQ